MQLPVNREQAGAVWLIPSSPSQSPRLPPGAVTLHGSKCLECSQNRLFHSTSGQTSCHPKKTANSGKIAAPTMRDTSAGNPKTRGPGNLTGGLTFLASHPADLGLQLFDLLFQISHSRAKFFQAVSLRDSPIHASQNGPHRIPGQIGHTARSRQRTKMQKRRVLLLGKPNANHAGTGLHDCHGRLTGTGPQDARGFKKERRNEGEQTALWSANSKTAQPPQRYCSLSIAPQTPGRLRPF